MAKSNSNLLIGIIVALLGLSGFLGYRLSTLNKVNNEKISKIEELTKFQAELDGEYQLALSSLENLKNDNQELNTLIESQKQELKAQKGKINDLIWTKRELDKAKQEMAKLNNLTQQYLGQINRMKKENELLASQNVELTQANDVLTTSLQSEKELSAELEQSKAALMSEKESLSRTNSMLSDKVTIASAIKLDNITFQAGSINDDGSFRKRILKGRMNVFHTCLTTSANLVVEPAEEIFNIRIIDEGGQTLNSDESAVITNKLNGEQVRYSTAGKMDYANESSQACISWDPPFDIQKGEYTVEVYNKGFRVGSGSFKI